MEPWERLATATAPDGVPLELRRRGRDWVIRAGGHELMSNHDEASSRSLAELGCARLTAPKERSAGGRRVLIGGLGMGFTLRAALDLLGPRDVVELSELVPAIVEWTVGPLELGALAGHPLRDPRTALFVGDVRARIREARARYHAILLDVDNGPIALAHRVNDALYGARGIDEAHRALVPGGCLAVWSLSDDARFTKRLARRGFDATAHRVFGSRQGRGREHVVWTAFKAA